MNNINIQIGVISYNNLEKDLFKFGEFDCDANGIDFLVDDAKDLGMKCNLEYWCYLATETYKNADNLSEKERYVKATRTFLDEMESSWSLYSTFTGYKIKDDMYEDKLFITFAYTDE